MADAPCRVELTDAALLKGAGEMLLLGGMTLIIRGKRPGEDPVSTNGIQHFEAYLSHNEWGTDHFGFTYHGDLEAFCEEIRSKGATFAIEPWEFSPGALLCYVAGPDGVSIELVQGKA